VVSAVSIWVQDKVVSVTWSMIDHPSASLAHSSAVPAASQSSSTSDPSDPAAATHA